MSKGYLVRKKIQGRVYLYRQRSWREGGKVKTECVCLGPVSDTMKSSRLEQEFGNPFSQDNTTNKMPEFGNPFLDGNRDGMISPADYLAQLQVEAGNVHEQRQRAWKDKPKRKTNNSIIRNTTKKYSRSVAFTGDLSKYKISEVALSREFEGLCQNLEKLGLVTDDLPTIQIVKGKRAGWRKTWFKRRAYVVLLPENGGRTQFKQAYRDALASYLMEELRRQKKDKYKELIAAAGKPRFSRGKEVREAITKIIQHGSKKARPLFKKQIKSKKGWDIQGKGIVGERTLGVLKSLGSTW